MPTRLRGDFNGLWGELLCLSHTDTAVDERGQSVLLAVGMDVTAFDPDTDDDGNPADLTANGVVIQSPEWLKCYGSKWALKIDERGVYHEPTTLRK
jgi:hypothetical protein